MDLDIDIDPPSRGPGAEIPSVEGAPADYSADLVPVGDSGITSFDVYNVINPVLSELAGEVRRSLEYFTSKFPDIPINRLIIFGGGARLRNIDVFMQNELGIRTMVANPFSHLTVTAAGVSQEYLHDLAPVMTVAVGLGLRDLLPGK
jgi:type IV pilus assembly protein PilM